MFPASSFSGPLAPLYRRALTQFERLPGRVSPVTLLLGLILAAGLALRWHGLDWDRGYGFHPDERDIYMRANCMFEALTNAPGFRACGYLRDLPDVVPGLPGLGVFLDPERSPLNPHWFPLGSILIYALVFLRSVMETVADLSAFDMRFVARGLSGLFDVGSVFLVFLLGQRLFGRKAGLLAAALTTLAVVHVQHSHFYRPETFASFFTLASFWAAFRMMERRRLVDSLLLGALVGLAVAPKVSGVVVMLPVALAYGFRLWDSMVRGGSGSREMWLRPVAHGAAMLAASAAAFFVASPYALLDFGSFSWDVYVQSYMVRNAGIWPFTVQYIGTPPFFYQFKQMAVFGLGLPLGLVAWLGIPFAAAAMFQGSVPFRPMLMVLAYVIAGLAIVESFEVRFLRYLFTLMPLMILLGSGMMVRLLDVARSLAGTSGGLIDRLRPRWGVPLSSRGVGRFLKWAALGLIVFVVASTAFYSVAFQKVYSREHPAVAASEWINENVKRGSAIVSDNHWDEFVPDLYRYNLWQYPLYEEDTAYKVETLARRLSRSEYLLFYSQRPYTSVSRDPERFPYSRHYYRLLFSGDLGYGLERAFTSYPSLWGVEFRDDPISAAGLPYPDPPAAAERSPWSFNLGYADDNVVGYDHPQVLLFRNEAGLSYQSLRELLVLELPESQGAAGPGPLMLADRDLELQRQGGTWSELFDRGSWTNRLPVLAWLLAVELVFLAALPLAVYIFRFLPDRGIVLARVLGLLAVSYLAWLAVSLGWIQFSRPAIVAAFAVLATLSILLLACQRDEIIGQLKQRWRLLLGVESLFILAFLAFVLLRAANPDLWHPWRGGEKPMELAYLNAVIKSSAMPPFDPWFAGGYLNYYYFGYVIPAVLVRITGIIPTTAFNLAVPLFFALTVTGAFSLVYNMAQGVRSFRNRELDSLKPAGSRGIWPVLKGPVGAGLLAGVFVAVAGNLDGMTQVVEGAWARLFHAGSPPIDFDFWRSSRMIPGLANFEPSPLAFWLGEGMPDVRLVSPHITEFPFFTFLFADFHAHLMVIPITLLVLGLGLNLLAGLGRGGLGWIIAAALALAVALGSLWAVNSWDYPTYLLLVLALLGLAAYRLNGPPQRRMFIGTTLAVGVAAGSLIAFWPFHLAYETFDSGLEASLWRTPLDRYLLIHGLFLFIAMSFLLLQLRQSAAGLLASNRRSRSHFWSGGWKPSAAFCGAAGLVFLFFALAGYWTAAALWVVLAVTLWAAWRPISRGGAGSSGGTVYDVFPLLLLAMGLAISIGLDLVRITGDIGRMNSLFKYYLEVWLLLGLASAFFLWRLFDSGSVARLPVWAKGAWLVALFLLLASVMVYPVWGTKDRLEDRFQDGHMTLDGTGYMNDAFHFEEGKPLELLWDLEAIEWLQDKVSGSPVVLEAHGEQYRWNSRIANYTGLPTVLGWPWHQTQQRMAYAEDIEERSRHVGYIYNTTSLELAEELLRLYRVEYIVIGELERVYYDARGLEKFLRWEESGHLERVFENEGTIIYHVRW